MSSTPLLVSMLTSGMNTSKDTVIKALSVYILNQLLRNMIDANKAQNAE